MPLFNIKNRKYLCDQVMQYEPQKMDADQVLKQIRKVYKMVERSDIIGDVPARRRLFDNIG